MKAIWTGSTTELTTNGRSYVVKDPQPIAEIGEISYTFINDLGQEDSGTHFEIIEEERLKIYLAGPSVFRQNAKYYGDVLKQACEAFGFIGLFPLDNEIEVTNEGEPSLQIFQDNLEMIEKADIVLADLTRFRGPSIDPGTAYEIGYAYALKKKVIGYNKDNLNYYDVVKSEGLNERPFTGVENFGLSDNLMIVHSLEDSFEELIEALVWLKENQGYLK